MKRTLLSVILAWAGTASSQSLLINPEFDTDLGGWTLGGAPPPVWDAFDIDDSATSGSALLTNSLAGEMTEVVALSQCFNLPLPVSFEFGISGYIPGGQMTSGSVVVRLNQHRDPDCTGGLGGTSGRFVVQSPTEDAWDGVVGSQVLLAGVDSVRFEVGIRKTEAEALSWPSSTHRCCNWNR